MDQANQSCKGIRNYFKSVCLSVTDRLFKNRQGKQIVSCSKNSTSFLFSNSYSNPFNQFFV